MKNLLIYIKPNDREHVWGEETMKLLAVQIDNSLDLGWDRKDLILITNFPYEYNGIRAREMNVDYFKPKATTAKISVICKLFEEGLEDDLYWFHDNDAFQMEELNPHIPPGKVGLTDYGITKLGPQVDKRWSTGVLFFRKDTEDVFKLIMRSTYSHHANEEIGLLAWCRINKHGIRERLEKLNITYNFAPNRIKDVKKSYEITQKPIKVIHFHPFDTRSINPWGTPVDICVYGKGIGGIPLVTERLINLFKKHQIT